MDSLQNEYPTNITSIDVTSGQCQWIIEKSVCQVKKALKDEETLFSPEYKICGHVWRIEFCVNNLGIFCRSDRDVIAKIIVDVYANYADETKTILFQGETKITRF